VTSAVDVFLRPARYLTLAANYPLRSIVDSILVAVRSASLALEAVHGPRVTALPGYRAALVETSVAINACVSAYALRLELESRRCRVLFGTYDLASRYVRLALTPEGRKTPSGIGLFPAPADDREARRIATAVAGSASVAALLRAAGGVARH
jgi:carbonic anhydrase